MEAHVSGSTEHGCVCVLVYSAVTRVVQCSASQRLPVLAVAVLHHVHVHTRYGMHALRNVFFRNALQANPPQMPVRLL